MQWLSEIRKDMLKYIPTEEGVHRTEAIGRRVKKLVFTKQEKARQVEPDRL